MKNNVGAQLIALSTPRHYNTIILQLKRSTNNILGFSLRVER